MKKIIGLSLFLIIIFFLTAASASGITLQTEQNDPLILTNDRDFYQPFPNLEVLVDQTAEFTYHDVVLPENQSRFQPADQVDYSGNNAAIWLRLKVTNQADEHTRWLVVYDQYRINHISAYLPDGDAEGIREVTTGNSYEFTSRDYDFRYYVFILDLHSEESEVIYFRLVDVAGVDLSHLSIQSLTGFSQVALSDQFAVGAFYAILITILIFNVFFIFSLRDKSTVSFVFFIFAELLLSLANDGVGHQYLWPGWPWFAQHSTIISITLFIMALLNYSLIELEIKKNNPRLDQFSRGIIALNLLLLILGILDLQAVEFLNIPVYITIIIGIGLPVVLAISTFARSRRRAAIFLSAFIGYLVIVILSVVIEFFANNTIDSLNFTRAAFVWILLVFTVTANDRISTIRREQKLSQELLIREKQAALHVQTKLNEEISQAQAMLEDRVRERTIELRESNRELESFSYSVSHDLRAPLRSIKGFSEIIREEFASVLPEDARRYFERIELSITHMEELIRDLLTLSRITREALQISPTDLSKIAEEILQTYVSSNPEIDAVYSVLPGLILEGDPSLIRIALQNVIDNAWKFSLPTGKVDISVGSEEIDGENVLYIRDQGLGFDHEDAEIIFDPFQRANSSVPGTGVGLAIVRRIVNRHGGRVWAESEAGKGTSIYISRALFSDGEELSQRL